MLRMVVDMSMGVIMSTVHDAVASVRTGFPRPSAGAPPRPYQGPTPCLARPGSRLVHLDGRCECFFGGPAPEFDDTPPSGTLP
jgi:hypothetical protein